MGACFFDCDITKDRAAHASDAFCKLRENARYEYGHGGYTGTIAEKEGYVFLGWVKSYNDAVDLGRALMDANCPLLTDKWNDAGAFEYDDGYYFFGVAPT